MNSNYFATTARGLEVCAAAELTALGATEVKPAFGGVSFSGDQKVLYNANLWLRTASRVLVPMRTFSAKSIVMLYDQVKRMKWEEYIDIDGTFAIDCTINNRVEAERGMHNPQFLSLKIKDAIVDRFRERTGRRPSIDVESPDVKINAYFQHGKCTLNLDASGGSLHERGYRLDQAHAPMKETLAAGIIGLTEWDGASPFIDPMCGSGTLALEAALKALHIAPGLSRKKFGFFGFKDFNEPLWDECVEKAVECELERLPEPIVGYDASRPAIASAVENAKRAGLDKLVHFERRDLERLEPVGTKPGVMIANPPYGERIGNVEELRGLYKTLGDLMKQRLQGWTGYIFTGNIELAKSVGLRASRRFELFNGPIECRLLKYDLYTGTKSGGKGVATDDESGPDGASDTDEFS